MRTLHKETIEVSARDLKAAWREAQEFEADRHPSSGRTTYMAHGKGYVLVRHPGCIPFVVTEAEWRAMPLWQKPHA